MKFKPGDRVVLIHDNFGWGREGEMGVILEYPSDIKAGIAPFRMDSCNDYQAPTHYHGFPEKDVRLATKLERVLK